MKTNYFSNAVRRGVKNEHELTPIRVGHRSDSILSRFCVVSLIYANKLLNHRTTPLGRFVLPEHLPFSKPKVNWLLHVSLICLCMLTIGVESAKGETLVLTFNGSTNAYSLVTSASISENTFTEGTITLGYKSCTDNSASGTHYIMFAKGAGVLYNKTALPGAITKVKVEYRDGTSEKSNLGVKCSATVKNTRQTSSLDATLITDGGSYDECDIAEANGYKYFNLSVQGGTSSSYGNIQVTKITITYAAASCSASPTVGNVANNGALVYSTAPMTVPVTCPSIGAGAASCSIKDYGFVWKAGGNPSISDNKTQIGTDNHSTAFSGNISGTFTAGTNYYVKAYAINNGDKTTLSTGTYSFTPRSITMNSNGGSAVTTILVISGTAATQPANPTKTGYTFGGWYTDNGTFASAVNWSSNITSNQTYYAKWTVKTTAITLNKNNSDASGSTAGSASYTYGESTKNSYTAATRTGYTLNGYYTATSAGTKILNADGSIAGSSIVVSTVTYTDGSGNWAYDNTALTLYAQWTVKNYSVTWKVNGEDYTTGTPTDNVNHGSHVTTLPTAPDPGSYCGDKFMGWTDADGGVYTHGTSNLYTSASQFPAAEGAQTFYAVFADYDE